MPLQATSASSVPCHAAGEVETSSAIPRSALSGSHNFSQTADKEDQKRGLALGAKEGVCSSCGPHNEGQQSEPA
jgi:hypothetical protein